MSSRRQHEQWGRLFAQKRHEFIESDCREALQISSFDDLQSALQTMAMEYQDSTFPDLINKLNPSLRHMVSFTKAISSASQADPHATLIWGAVQAVMESACQNQYAVDEMLTVVATLNDTLPLLDKYTDLLAGSIKLQFQLQDLYDTYMNFCIASVQYIKRSGTANFLFYFVYSSPQKLLETTKSLIIQQTKTIRKSIMEANFEQTRHERIQQVMSTNPLSEIPSDVADDADNDLSFPISTVLYYRNWTFLGRDGVLGDMHRFLNPDQSQSSQDTSQRPKHGSSPRCVILRGLGGIGKTQIALEHSYRCREDYSAIFWVRAESGHALAAAFSDISKALYLTKDLDDPKGQEQGRATKRATEWLSKTKRRWLLIFDNAEAMDDLNPYFPFNISGDGDVIITTQKADFFPVTDPDRTLVRDIENLDRDEGAAIIFKYLQRNEMDDDERSTACSISDLVGGLPLALATIGGYLNQVGGSIKAYYNNLEVSSKAWTSTAIGPAQQYEKTLESVFDHALKELPEGPRSLINMLAFLNADSIPEEMFVKNIGTDKLPFVKSEAELIDMIATLRKRQLVRRDTSGDIPFLSIHRTVQWSVILSLSKNYNHRWVVFQQAFKLLKTCLPEDSSVDQPEPETWKEYDRYVPQLLQLRSHCLWPEPPVDLPVDFAQILSDVATYTWHAGLIEQGLQAMHTAEHILDDHDVKKDHPLRGKIHEHLGIIASFYGVSERDEALKRREKALEARKAEFEKIPMNKRTSDDKIRRWNVESDMAFGHLQWEDFDACEKQLEKCLEQYKQWGSEEDIPFEYLKYNQCVCYVRMSQGRPARAVEHAKRSAELSEECTGRWGLMTYICRFALMNMLYLAGELEEALKESQNVLDARLKICGEYNHWTLEAYAFRASLLAKAGKFTEAQELYVRCLDRRKWSVWNPESVARTQFLYAQTLEKLGKDDEAQIQLQKARKTKDYSLKHYPQWLSDDETEELVVFDQMVSIWAGRYTGKLRYESATGERFVDALDYRPPDSDC